MKNILKILSLFIFFTHLLFSAQEKKENMEKEITEKINFQKEGMLYQLKYQHKDCSYEILVNDIPVITHYGIGERSGLTVDINQYILKPGKQEVTIRMYPKKTDNTVFDNFLSSNSYVKIYIKKGKRSSDLMFGWDARAKGEIIQWDLNIYTTPTLEKEIPYAEYKTSFEVDPKDLTWNIKGWAESQNLKNDPNLKKEVQDFYDDFKKTLEDGNQSKYLDMLKNSIYEDAASQPWNKNDAKYLVENMAKYATEPRSFIYPCNQSELKYYGEGRVVTLVCKDLTTFGYSPLISKTAKNMMPKSHTFYLHKPKGSDKLEIIR